MYQRLLLLNQSIGKVTLDEVYAMTPREVDTIVAGGLQHGLNQLEDQKFALNSTIVPSVMVDTDKFDYKQIDQELQKRQERIDALTDHQVQKKLETQHKQRQRFMDIFNLNTRKGGRD